MRHHTYFFGMLAAALVFSGCAAPDRSGSYETGNAFISYQPRPEGSTALRLAVKDMIDTKGSVTSAGSKYLFKNGTPALTDAECLRIARQRNVWIVGKTNLGELGLGVSGANNYFGTPLNPVRPKLRFVPGGSSSGSAVAVATDMADVAFGTDTAGSIRVPAACCGVVGLKTTFGLVSLKGVMPISAQNLDTVGPLAKDIPRLIQGMDLLEEGFAAKYRRAKAEFPSGRSLRVGRLYVDGTNKAVDEAVDNALGAAGFRVVRLSPLFTKQWEQANKDGATVAAASGWLADHEYLGKSGINAITKAAIRLGKLNFDTGYKEALARRPIWQRILRETFEKVDLIATPTLRNLPPSISFLGRSATLELRVFDMQNTVAVNFSGNPAIAVPIPAAIEKAPISSLQLIAPPRHEAELVRAGQIVEEKVWKTPLGKWARAQ